MKVWNDFRLRGKVYLDQAFPFLIAFAAFFFWGWFGGKLLWFSGISWYAAGLWNYLRQQSLPVWRVVEEKEGI